MVHGRCLSSFSPRGTAGGVGLSCGGVDMNRCAVRPLVRATVDDIPLLCAPPEESNGRLALWIPYFGGTKEDGARTLRRFAQAGFIGVGIDPWQHGDRATSESPGEFSAGVFAAFRSRMWPIRGRTTLDAMRVIDWADELHGVGSRGGCRGVPQATRGGAPVRITTHPHHPTPWSGSHGSRAERRYQRASSGLAPEA